MKGLLLASMLCIGALLSAAGGSSAAAEPDYYEELIAAARDSIETNGIETQWEYGFSSAILTAGAYGTAGYMIKDIDGNGVDELIFGENGDEPRGLWDGTIYDIYTISEGQLVHVAGGWDRNRYYFCDNGMIANEGSSGAANSNYSFFTFAGTELTLVESVIYDGFKDADHPWFYSTESRYDAENADPINEEQAMAIRGKYVYEHPEFIPFG